MSHNIRNFWLPNFRTYLVYICCYFLIMVVAGSHIVNGLKCFCNPEECDVIRSQDCPGKGLLIWDPCKCCKTCAKILGETCGGPGGFSGSCEPPLECVAKLPISNGLGVCMDLPLSSSSLTYLNCTNDQTIVVEEGCEIVNKKCQCWPTIKICKDDSVPDIRWNFRTLEDCELNLQNLIEIEMDFDEDYTISPITFTYKKFRGKRRSIIKGKRL